MLDLQICMISVLQDMQELTGIKFQNYQINQPLSRSMFVVKSEEREEVTLLLKKFW